METAPTTVTLFEMQCCNGINQGPDLLAVCFLALEGLFHNNCHCCLLSVCYCSAFYIVIMGVQSLAYWLLLL